MSMRMLIDARHPEETRVAVVKGNRIEEFDFEAAAKKQLKGNIYLAKVTRVEPSLQAAFIEYGGNRHGFLAFSEIHPDYYQIPKEDREALLREEREAHRHDEPEDHDGPAEQAVENGAAETTAEAGDEDAPPPVDEHGGHEETASEALRARRMNLRRRYKIQEVIHRRQVMLVQVVKEERGNKGAALTTYLSLAGRYSVLMPNTSHGGGISRKISNTADRKRLKEIIADLALPVGMGCIVRTAGLKRTKTEIRRDFDYLARLWDEIREATLKSSAPALIYEDSDLIKRAIRDIYSREIDEVLVEGEEGYKSAKAFMKLLMPSHAKKVKQYIDPVPLFQRNQVEAQLASMYHPVVQLKSGGYIVINPTEALVSIDINSGRSTREHNIEETAVKTNMEAAEEIARQLRLRDMAGLVVIDFIDMEHGGNVRKVERCLKEAVKNDRARIQIGRISSFGLMEMSRQRLRTGMLEASTHTCPMCDGAGIVRSVPSAALAALRGLEAEALVGRASQFCLRAGSDVAVYILNRKRDELIELENRYGISIEVVPDPDLIVPNFAIDSAGPPPVIRPAAAVIAPLVAEDDDEDVIEEEYEEEEEAEETRADSESRRREPAGDEDGEGRSNRNRRRRKRRPRRGDRDQLPDQADMADTAGEAELGEDGEADVDADAEAGDADDNRDNAEGSAGREDGQRRPRRRGRRGGRRRNGERGEPREAGDEREGDTAQGAQDGAETAVADDAEAPATVADAAVDAAAPAPQDAVAAAETDAAPAEDAAPAKPARRRRTPRKTATVEAVAAETGEDAVVTDTAAAPAESVEAAPAVSEDTAAAEDVAADDAPKKRAPRKRAPAKRTKAAAVAATADAADTVEQAAAEPAPVAAAPEAVVPETAAAEAAPAVPATDAAPSEENAIDAPSPRKGWWQRTFGA